MTGVTLKRFKGLLPELAGSKGFVGFETGSRERHTKKAEQKNLTKLGPTQSGPAV